MKTSRTADQTATQKAMASFRNAGVSVRSIEAVRTLPNGKKRVRAIATDGSIHSEDVSI